jgi:hypothetical protein
LENPFPSRDDKKTGQLSQKAYGQIEGRDAISCLDLCDGPSLLKENTFQLISRGEKCGVERPRRKGNPPKQQPRNHNVPRNRPETWFTGKVWRAFQPAGVNAFWN